MLRESSAKIMDIEVLKRFDYNTKLGFDGELWLCLSLPIGVSTQSAKRDSYISDIFGFFWVGLRS